VDVQPLLILYVYVVDDMKIPGAQQDPLGGGIPKVARIRKLATKTDQARMGKDKARASRGKTSSEQDRGRRRRLKGKPCEGETPPRASSTKLSLHGRSESCGDEPSPCAPSATLSLH
jgi:hypothetical protein